MRIITDAKEIKEIMNQERLASIKEEILSEHGMYPVRLVMIGEIIVNCHYC